MAKGLDIGTAFLVKSEIDQISESVSFTSERNCFLKAATTEDTENTLKENNWSYAKYENEHYILGEDAIKLKNLLTIKSEGNQNLISTKISDLRRPMKDGVLNTGEDKLAIAMIQKLIGNLIGPPSYPGEVLCFCAPGDPVNNSLSVVFHKSVLTGFLKSMGYTVECIPEALSIIYSERPVADDPTEPKGEAPYSGVSLSFGGGMVNCAYAFKKIPLINFSICGSGDWIDKESAKVAGIEVPAMTKYKEQKLDLDNIEVSDMKQMALDIFYQSMIENAIKNFAEKFNQLDHQVDVPLEIVIAGGTASVPGFLNKFKNVLSTVTLPFKVKNVRMAENPLYAVANGCLIKAISTEKKTKTEDKKGKEK